MKTCRDCAFFVEPDPIDEDEGECYNVKYVNVARKTRSIPKGTNHTFCMVNGMLCGLFEEGKRQDTKLSEGFDFNIIEILES